MWMIFRLAFMEGLIAFLQKNKTFLGNPKNDLYFCCL